ncbi:MAG: hypothetical protein Q8N84_03605 [bacterium]|nr:hypothetical protein [bacterium]
MKLKFLPLLGLLGAILACYLLTAPVGLTWENAELYEGKLVTAVTQKKLATFGTSPLYLLLSRPFLESSSNPAKNLNSLSTFIAISILGVVAAAIYLLTKNHAATLIGTAFLATNPLFWKYGTNANYNVLSLLFYSLSLFFLLEKRYFLLGLACGLALSSSPQALIFGGLALLLILKTKTPSKKKPPLAAYLTGLIAGASPLLLYLGSAPQIVGESWLAWLLPLNLSPSAFTQSIIHQIELIFGSTNGLFLVLAALGVLWEEKSKEKTLAVRILLLMLVAGVIFNVIRATPNPEIYLLPEILILALLAGLCVDFLARLFTPLVKTKLAVAYENRFFLLIIRLKDNSLLSQTLVYISLLILFLTPTIFGAREIVKTSQRGSRNEAQNYLDRVDHYLPTHALVLSDDPKIAQTLNYLTVLRPKKLVIVTATDFPYNQQSLDELASSGVTVPEQVVFGEDQNQGLQLLTSTVQKALLTREVYLAPTSPPPPNTVGTWQGFKLTSVGPLFKLTRE